MSVNNIFTDGPAQMWARFCELTSQGLPGEPYGSDSIDIPATHFEDGSEGIKATVKSVYTNNIVDIRIDSMRREPEYIGPAAMMEAITRDPLGRCVMRYNTNLQLKGVVSNNNEPAWDDFSSTRRSEFWTVVAGFALPPWYDAGTFGVEVYDDLPPHNQVAMFSTRLFIAQVTADCYAREQDAGQDHQKWFNSQGVNGFDFVFSQKVNGADGEPIYFGFLGPQTSNQTGLLTSGKAIICPAGGGSGVQGVIGGGSPDLGRIADALEAMATTDLSFSLNRGQFEVSLRAASITEEP